MSLIPPPASIDTAPAAARPLRAAVKKQIGSAPMRLRLASINDLAIGQADRLFHWPLGRRPDDHASLDDLGL